MKSQVRYYVWYGACASKQACSNLAEVNAFVAHCLREGTPISAITKATLPGAQS